MKDLCLHCDKRPRLPSENLCEVCIKYPRCEGCQVIFGEGFTKPSSENPNRCDSCLNLEELIDFYCKTCGNQIPLFYSPNSNSFHFIVRGNFCGHCNNVAAIEARRRKPREDQDFTGYLAILSRQLAMGKISEATFVEAKLFNKHDILNPKLREEVDEMFAGFESGADLLDYQDEEPSFDL